MRITQWGEYGVLCSLQIARREQEGAQTIGAAEIAKDQGIAIEYAQQILQRLRKGGIIESVRGPHGGYKLARPVAEISLGDILSAAEGDTFEVICETKPLDASMRCAPEAVCSLRPLWYELRDHLNSFLNARSLKDLLNYEITATVADTGPIQIGRRDTALSQ